MLRVTFADSASRDSFANRFKLDSKVGDTQLDIGWHLLQFAKLDDKALDYDEVAVLTAAPGANSEREFVVKGDPAKFGAHATVVKDLGAGFYLVKATDGTLLGDHVDSIEHNSAPMTFLENVGSITGMNTEATSIDPTSPDGQWARIRVASRYRPLLEQFDTHGVTYFSKPELYIMDSGIDFTHPEFDFAGCEKENFYTLPAFNGSFADDVGHGTAVASMACGKNLGVAGNLKLINVKIGGATHNATLIEVGEAIDAIVARASASPMVTRIVNMSWGVARSSWLDAKVQSLIDLGITVVCAAGNSGISVEDISPAGLDTVITVASMDKYDIPSGFNNISPSDAGVTTGYGLSLDIFAPGENVMLAKVGGGYGINSGTSFSAPMVAGVAAQIASLNSGFVPYTQLKQTILDTATPDALLFENDNFSENQNKIVYLFTSDGNSNYKNKSMTMYVGVHTTDDPLVLDLNSTLDAVTPAQVFPDDPVVFSVEFYDPAIEAEYGQFFHVNPTTGVVTIDKPTVALPEETKLKMVEFKGVAKTSRLSMETTVLFFFHSNPLYKDTLESDVTLALTDTNSISFYAAWQRFIK
jgi:hypothetical protein